MIDGMPIAYARVGDIPDMMTETVERASQFQGLRLGSLVARHHFRQGPDTAKVLTMDEARRVASNIAKLPGLLEALPLHKGMRVESLTSTYSVGVIHMGSSCGQPGEENSKIAMTKWPMVAMPPLLSWNQY